MRVLAIVLSQTYREVLAFLTNYRSTEVRIAKPQAIHEAS
jgi:hypothetical protein